MFTFLKRSVVALLFFIPQTSSAQVVVPQPQEATISEQRFVPAHAYKVSGLDAGEQATYALFQSVLPVASKGKTLPLKIKKLKKGDAKLQRSGAYKLDISPKGIGIEAYDNRSVFYAAQTLSQLVQKERNGNITLPEASITDYPDVAYRGTVEGFYGDPWSHQDRLEQLRFYGKLKLNTYIYGPKDDPYHSSPHWRDPYPAMEAQQIRQLTQEAKNNKVDFVWAIHPGKDIQWSQADSSAIITKFNQMYDLGVRAFAVFFDDITGVGTDAKMQANLLNYIQRQFINQKRDVAPLIMCPTEYNKGWANKEPGTYLDILGEQLDPAIHVMWTGNTVVHDITKEGLEWVNKRIQRPAYVWWNFPVSDYVRNHLLMGPSYGIDTKAAQDMSGFVSNPMDKAEASKPAIFSVALYSWNMQAYDPQLAWEAANRYVMPEAPEAFRIFNAHNSDPGPNGHHYRRDESVEIKPYIHTFLEAYNNGKYKSEAAARINEEFAGIAKAPAEIRSKSRNKRLVEQISPWLLHFEFLGKAGSHVMAMAENRVKASHAAAWADYLQLEATLDSMATVNATFNQNPYQPGVRTGSLVLTPFIEDIFKQTGNYFLGLAERQSQAGIAGGTAISTAYGKSQKLGSQPLLQNNKDIAYSPMLEVAFLDSGEYIGFKPSEALQATALHFNLSNNNLLTWGAFETSKDGQVWTKADPTTEHGKGSIVFNDPAIKYVRLRNSSDKRQNFYLKEFRLEVKPVAGKNESVFAHDKSISTYQTLTSQQPVTVTLPQELKGTGLVVLLKTEGASYSITAPAAKGKRQTLYSGRESYIQLDSSKLKGVTELTFSTGSNQPVRIYELVKQQPAS
ncbi:beta-N-acetylhexosaminidase family protein [Pontibacter virosus]|uniref:Hyaluronoglucosaminidase n=1 Tax=Pontibacter virosus TaxID=1765052 RepID=A0A2U1B500_9BACT|nr:beta-N-acetylglucosaminidase domain-containing protein [Pontibacter virosus]PVY43755.1 hyaluronoglucosaminidase [Pontibacter virosus]